MKVIALSEGAYTIDKTKKFIPFDLTKDQLNNRPIGSLLVEIQPFMVITDKDIIILDTGLGFKDDSGIPIIYKNLELHGIHPEKVTKVLLSHLHKDHSGGLSIETDEGKSLAFKNARYYINKSELANALTADNPSYIINDLNTLNNNPQVQLLDQKGTIDGYIDYAQTGGHSIYHQVFWIRENGEVVFFGGDVAPQLQQMKSRFVAKYDLDGKKSMELRREWLERGTQEKWIFLFYHDIKNPVYKFPI